MCSVKWLERDSTTAQQSQPSETITNQQTDSLPMEVIVKHSISQEAITGTSQDESKLKSPLTKVLNSRQKADKEKYYHDKDTQKVSTRAQSHQSPKPGSKDTLDRSCQKKSQPPPEHHHISKTPTMPKYTRSTAVSPATPTRSKQLVRGRSREAYHLREEHHERKQHLSKRDKENKSSVRVRRSERKRKRNRSISPPQPSNGVTDLRERLKRKRYKQEPTPRTNHIFTDNANPSDKEQNSLPPISSSGELIEENLLELEYDEPPLTSSTDPPTPTPPSSDGIESTTSNSIENEGIASPERDTNDVVVEASTLPTKSVPEDELPSSPNETESTPSDTENELEDGEIEDGEIKDEEIEEELDNANPDPIVSELRVTITCHSRQSKSRQRLQPSNKHLPPPRTYKVDYHSRERRKSTDRRGCMDDRRHSSSRCADRDLYSRRDNRRH